MLKLILALALVMLISVVCSLPTSGSGTDPVTATSNLEQFTATPTATNVVSSTLTTTATPAATFTPNPPEKLINASTPAYGSITIVGDPTFIEWTQRALSLLESETPDAYEKIETYVGIIEQSDRSGMWVYEEPPRYEVSDVTAFFSLTWYASTIAHDATHSEFYHQYQESFGSPVPDDIWTSVSAEQFCISFQLDVLIRIGGPPSEVEYLGTQTGDHCDIDGDGDCDWDDYYGRDW